MSSIDGAIGWPVALYAVTITMLSVASFTLYGMDKRRAQLDGPRIPERTLHTVDLVGGWPGGWLARRVFRHKTRKLSFVVAFWLTVVLHLGCVGVAAYLWLG
ncbi:DUF1294 domain-containing protein [Roseiconus nitratireducens]|uniref:DUF1294 domain-containing protein n=1 Tax=Roseiconus nitratireducens TaxID=2605748 RepID=UPI001F18B6C5|nr:DUF1294 domain-containing protein [Roseiconus nitratireducens]